MPATPEPPEPAKSPEPAGKPPASPELPTDPQVLPAIRASDDERETVVRKLSEHATTGRLTLAELEERIGLAYRATTRAELEQLTRDLPDVRVQPTSASSVEPTRRRSATKWIVAVMGGTEKRGRWRVAERVNAVAIMGGHDIDLRDAELESDDTTILAISVMGGMDIYVPDTVDVEVKGFSFMGGTSEKGSGRSPRPGAPRIRLYVYNLMGGTDIWRLPEEARGLPIKEARRLAKRTI